MNGSIPKDVTTVSAGTEKIGWQWDDIEGDGMVDETEVIPAFSVDAANKKTLETARSWAQRRLLNYEYDPVSKKHIPVVKTTVKEETRPNDPIEGIRILSLEKREEGGRAYKVITPDNYYYDLREDVLLDTMKSVGIKKGGVLNGKFVWGRANSQMKLVRVGSALHKALIESTERGKLKKLKPADYKVGNMYSTKAGVKHIFLGWVSAIVMLCDNTYRYNSPYDHSEITSKKEPKIGLWMVNVTSKESAKAEYEGTWPTWASSSYELKKASSVILDEGPTGIDFSGAISKLRQFGLNKLQASYALIDVNYSTQLNRSIGYSYSFYRNDSINRRDRDRAQTLASYSHMVNITEVGSPFIPLPEYVEFFGDKFYV